METPKYNSDKDAPTNALYGDMIELILGGGADAVIAFRPSEAAHERAYELIDREKSGRITDAEVRELNTVMELEHILRMAKIRAHMQKRETVPA